MPHQPVPKRTRGNARQLRKDMTEAERRLWHRLRAHRLAGLGFRRQYPIEKYIVDFACPTHRIVVEVDGEQHGFTAERTSDAARTAVLAGTGWLVLRFWNHEIMSAIDSVCETILANAKFPEPRP